MRIYSWNMMFRNRELDRAFEFISHADFDIFCLQEVPEEFLKRLQELSTSVAFSIAHYSDVERLFPDSIKNNFVVTLSRYPIKNQGEIQFPEYWYLLPLRTRIFVRLMRPFGFSMVRNRGGLFINVDVSGKLIQIMNLHLILAQPAWRLKEFELAMAKRDPSRPTIVCGDFNTIEAPHISILNWILGGKVSDAFFHRRERTNIQERFVQYELVNALAGSVTHQLSRSQLDHILVSHTFTIKKAEVLSDRVGSDHHPIRVEIE